GHKWRDLVSDANQNPYAVEFLLATMFLAEGDEASALKHLKKAQKADSGQPILYLRLGEVYEKMKRFTVAEKAYNKALELDHEVPEVFVGLSRTALAGKKNQAAAHFALDALALRFHQPEAHYLLGWALHRLNEIPRAVQALKTAVAQNPNYPQAYRRLAYIYKKRLHLIPEADAYRQQAQDARRRLRDLKSGKISGKVNDSEKMAVRAQAARSSDQEISGAEKFSPEAFVPEKTILIVSGLPRSGTSMMMQMLAAGGRDSLVDDHRLADDDNPKGYFEFIKARKLRQDDSWLPDACGKTVKIVTQLLHHLPPQSEEFKYRVIMMERDDDEVLASQARMLENRKRQGGRLPDKFLKETFRKQVDRTKLFLATRKIPLLVINYQNCLAEPSATAARVNNFLGQSLESGMMATAVDKQLYRQHKSLLS
ncbi:MAG: tetratricopeptide repeat protein, partial [Deltaproteobacteria bacterium]|nr:tetratricopeptide repeat protein [Candidatus Tharpella aukensis]